MNDGSSTDMSHQRLATLVGCIRGIVLEFDADCRYVNAWADDEALFAAPPEELVGRTIDEVLGPEIAAPFNERIRRVFDTGLVENIEYPLLVNGVRRWFFADIKRVGTPAIGITVVLFARDITERRAAEEALRVSEERFQLAAHATNDVLWDWDIGKNVIAWGASARRAFGLDAVETAFAWWHDRVHPDDARRVGVSIAAALTGDVSSWSDSYRFRGADGSYGDFVDRAFVVRDAAGAAIRMVGSMVDVTELNRLHAQLIRADRLAAIGLLAAGVGHEINNPLTYLRGNLALAIEGLEAGEPPEDLTSMLVEAREGAARIADIVKRLKLFSRDDDVAGAASACADVHGALEQAIRMADNEIKHRARLVRDFAPVPPVRASESQIAQVVLDLLIHAAHAIDEGDRDANEVRIATAVDAGGRVCIAVSDTGRAMAPADVDRAFDPYRSTHANAGLGLSICHGIVQRIGGEVVVESSKVGSGNTFVVRLPTETAGAGRGEASPPSHAVAALADSDARPKVLVVDDEAPVGRIIARMLRNDADVVTMTSSRDALARLVSGESFDVVLCDLMMPEITGIELYDVVRAKRPDLLPRVYFMSGGAFTPRAQEFLASLGRACIDKPLDAATLRSVVRDAAKPAPTG